MGVNIIPFRVSDKMKEAYLLAAITAEYKAEDETGGVNIPYFIRAKQKVDAIKQRGELDKEYRNYKKKEKDLEESIKKAIKKGKTECTFLCSYDLIESMTAKAEEAGYRVTPVQGGVKIYWG